MQIRPEQLEQFLKQGLSPCYLVTGAEPLIVQECADAIRVAAREQIYFGDSTGPVIIEKYKI